MLKYSMIAIKVAPNNYNGLLVDTDYVVEGRNL